jgi:hypothetical protein
MLGSKEGYGKIKWNSIVKLIKADEQAYNNGITRLRTHKGNKMIISPPIDGEYIDGVQ